MRDKAASSGSTRIAIAVSLLVHGGLAATLAAPPQPRPARPDEAPVQFEIVEPPPPPPPPPEPEPEPVQIARAAPRRAATPEPPPEIPPPTPPPPENLPPPEPPPTPTPAHPVFGVTPEATSPGDTGMAVPAGNTLGTSDRRPADPAAAPRPYAGGSAGGSVDGTAAFAPVPSGFVRDFPVELQSVQAPYPDQARRMDVEGTVRLRVGIDEKGRTREVKVIGKVGHGLDEAAVAALRAFLWKPAIAHDGRPVPVRIPYNYIFRLPR